MRPRAWLVTSALVSTACTTILGVRDNVSFDEHATTIEAGADSGGDDGSVDGPAGDDGGGCGDTTSDPKNCGSCGHDCLGSKCTNGTCDDKVLATGLDNPNGIFVDATYVYLTLYSSGSVVRVKKDGSAGPEVLASGQTSARGVQSDGTNLFWSNGDFPGDGGGGYVGGVWKCSLASCATTRQLVTTGDWAFNVFFANDLLYFAENNNGKVVRVQPDGGGRLSFSTSNKPFTVVADTDHIYYQTNYQFVQRALPDGGGEQDFAPFDPAFNLKGYLAIDATRVYYTYTDGKNKGQAISAPKEPLGATKIQYGKDMDPAVGIAVDDTYVYWSTEKAVAGGDPDGTGGGVWACKKTGCDGAPVPIFTTTTGGVMASDGKAVYFAESGIYGQPDGKLHMVARP